MAYTPKYAQKSSNPGSPWLAVLLVPLSLALTALLLRGMLLRAPQVQEAPIPPVAVPANDLGDHLTAEVASIRENLIAPEAPTAPTEEVIPPYEVRYTLDPSLQAAPKPNQALFGESADPAVLAEVLKEARYILDGQETFFTPDVPLFADTPVRYYLDETIFAVTWKEARDNSVYTFSEVKIGHPSQFRRHLSDGQYGSGKLYLPTEMAATVNAVVATSGDFYANRPVLGVMVHDGTVLRGVEDTHTQTCFIDKNGDMIFAQKQQLKNRDTAQAFVDENDILFSVAFGPILVEDSQVVELPVPYSVGEIREKYARSALCQMDKLHYLVAVANWEGDQPDDPTVARFQKVVATTGCRMAYCLDGGQTAAVVMNDQLINRPAKGEQRRISDILYFATAMPEGG